jgi:hypothetical protein
MVDVVVRCGVLFLSLVVVVIVMVWLALCLVM